MSHGEKTPVTLLQELLMKKQLMPTYSLIYNRTGTHDPLFKYEVSASGTSAIGSGKSKKEAKHEAARLLLEKLSESCSDRIEDISEINVNSPYAEVLKDNAVGKLAEYCAERNLRAPEYDIIRDEGLPHAKLFSYKCCVSSFSTEAQAGTKKQAKQKAALEMLNKLKECLQDIMPEPMPKETDFEKSNEVVMKRLVEMGYKKRNASEQLGIKIADYYKVFLNEAHPKSSTLETLKDYDGSYFKNMESPESVCKTILEELDFQYRLEELKSDSVAVILTIEGTPTWAFFGHANNFDAAAKQAYVEALIFMTDMVKC